MGGHTFLEPDPEVFLYPLQPHGLLLRLPFLLFFIKYNLQVLAETSEGRLRPPSLAAALTTDGYSLPFKLFAVYFVLAILQELLARLSGSWLIMAAPGLLANLLLPAMTTVLTVSGSLLEALTPTIVVGLIARIVWPYLALSARADGPSQTGGRTG